MIATKKAAGGAEIKRPFMSGIKVNGVPILPPLMDKTTKMMAIEAKNRAIQLEMELGWTTLYQKQNYTEIVPVKMRKNTVQDVVGRRNAKEQCGKMTRAFLQCKCGRRDQAHFTRKSASTSCLTDGSLYAITSSVPSKMQLGSSSVGRSSTLLLSQSAGSVKVLRKCSSVDSLAVRDQNETKSPLKCTCCRRGDVSARTSSLAVVSGIPLFSLEQQKVRNSKIISSPTGCDRNMSKITYMKGGGLASAESELSLVSPQKCRESDNSMSDATWASGFYRQIFPLDYEEDRNFESESSDSSSEKRLIRTGSTRAATAPGDGSHTASLDYISARESSVALLDIPACSSTDSCRLVRQGSYILDKPSEVLLDHLKKQSTGGGENGIYQPVKPTKESSVQTEVEVFELLDSGDDSGDLGARSKVSELREKLRKRFDAAMEMLLVKQRQEQEQLTKIFLQVQQSTLLQMKASAVINAAARGFLIRRLMKTKYVQDLIETMEESLKCIFELKGESFRPLRADRELYDRLLQQLTAACNTFYETFFDVPTAERMKLIAADRERLKYLQLKAASLGIHSIRPVT